MRLSFSFPSFPLFPFVSPRGLGDGRAFYRGWKKKKGEGGDTAIYPHSTKERARNTRKAEMIFHSISFFFPAFITFTVADTSTKGGEEFVH